MTAPAKPGDAWTEESEARLRWFAEITQGDTKQWSGPNDESPLPGLRADIRAALTEVSAAEARGFREGLERAERAAFMAARTGLSEGCEQASEVANSRAAELDEWATQIGNEAVTRALGTETEPK